MRSSAESRLAVPLDGLVAPLRDGLSVCFPEDAGGMELISANYRSHRFDAHFHDSYSISVTLRGGLAFDRGGSKQVAPSGIISAINPSDLHNAYPASDEGWAFLCFLIPVEFLRMIVQEVSERDEVPVFRQRVITDATLASRLVRLHGVLRTLTEPLERQSLYVSTLAHLIQRHSIATARLHPADCERTVVKRAREFLHGCYTRRISLTELAASSGLSRFHFLRVFRSEVGLTPHVYLNHLRVQEAKRQLAGGRSISEVALNCGFVDQSHLNRRFKQVLGFTPGEYRIAQTPQRKLAG